MLFLGKAVFGQKNPRVGVGPPGGRKEEGRFLSLALSSASGSPLSAIVESS